MYAIYTSVYKKMNYGALRLCKIVSLKFACRKIGGIHNFANLHHWCIHIYIITCNQGVFGKVVYHQFGKNSHIGPQPLLTEIPDHYFKMSSLRNVFHFCRLNILVLSIIYVYNNPLCKIYIVNTEIHTWWNKQPYIHMYVSILE